MRHGKKHLIPTFQPKGTVDTAPAKTQRFKTKHTGFGNKQRKQPGRRAAKSR
ncbi:hypothetical protein [Methylotuvimicrobium alcaliphilum]|uniref:hypothetical protein n=1 Tax=Methylotuvimicrobium alcaliphilum TaxID=271065 RepID=UPI0002E2299B|nr:hypothetical protein [Methylotuvimicrobium alcaliphilum]